LEEVIVKTATFILALASTVSLCAAPATGQQTSQGAAAAASPAGVSRTIKAVNYRRASGSTKVSFQASELMRGGYGDAKVQNKNNRMEIELKLSGMDDATKFGLEYLTYVLWAVSPEGRAENLGEVMLKNGTANVKAITDMQTFGMIVTAEPYFAVTQPGNMVVLESVPGAESTGVENVSGTYELLGRGVYSSSNTKIDNAIFGIDRNTPLELFEARNSVRIAGNAEAGKYASTVFAKAQQQLANAETDYRQRRDVKTIESDSRDVVETAEEARVMAAKKQAEEQAQAAAAAEKKAAEERAAQAQAEAAAEAQRRADAEQATQAALAQQQAAEKMKEEAEAAAAEAAKQKTEAEQARQAALAQQQAAEAEAQKAAQAQAAAEAEAQQAKQVAAQAESEKAQLRAQLLDQLNAVLQTRDTARGLIVNMSDVLFDTASFTLRPAAREKLAKISGILLAHPGLTLQIEGHTDSVGTDDFNQALSEHRALSVMQYLADQGVAATSMTAKGFGKTQPMAPNDTPEGRQKNRRVELVVNGDSIGAPASSGTTNPGND
jgi:outer membrane protein OmpA-like peptidoglycan-associated protein